MTRMSRSNQALKYVSHSPCQESPETFSTCTILPVQLAILGTKLTVAVQSNSKSTTTHYTAIMVLICTRTIAQGHRRDQAAFADYRVMISNRSASFDFTVLCWPKPKSSDRACPCRPIPGAWSKAMRPAACGECN